MSFVKEIEEFAVNKLEPGINDYLNRGAQLDVTLNANTEAFNRLRIRPRYLVDVSKRDLRIDLFGDTIRMPVCVSPSGLHRRFHPNGEFETAKGMLSYQTTYLYIDQSLLCIPKESKNRIL